jgi:hypothetical protein
VGVKHCSGPKPIAGHSIQTPSLVLQPETHVPPFALENIKTVAITTIRELSFIFIGLKISVFNYLILTGCNFFFFITKKNFILFWLYLRMYIAYQKMLSLPFY